MRSAAFFFVLLLLGVAFEVSVAIEKEFAIPRQNWFLTINWVMAFNSLVYYYAEHLIVILSGAYFCIILWLISTAKVNVIRIKTDLGFAIIYAVLQFLDMVDFGVTGNTQWFNIWGWPITFNAVKVFIFVLSMIYVYVGRFNP